jgi:LmbE family N-acetylglucosaminyl deacetylase
MLASFGLEIVECGGALARHVQAGDRVHAAVLLSRPESRPQVQAAARILGLGEVEFLGVTLGEVAVDVPTKELIVELIRRVKPDILIAQDPQHAQHDLDPDRRMIALLYSESIAVASRDWHIDACGGHPPHPIPTIYYMTPEHPNCVIEISSVFALKMEALGVLASQMAFSAQVTRTRVNPDTLRHVVPSYDAIADDDVALGLALHRSFEQALALRNGLAGHGANAVLGEAYRREGMFTFDRLPG